MSTPRFLQLFLLVFVMSALWSANARAQQILPVTADAWPNGRTWDEHTPAVVIDGDLDTFTWTTDPYTTDMPVYIGLDFGSAYYLNRIRLWKDNDDGCGSEGSYALVIQYTTDEGPLSERGWHNVPNLKTGFHDEFLHATAVNSDGTISGESHDSVNEGHGWASLTFDVVAATGVSIAFTTSTCIYNHYKVHEFEAYYESTIAVQASTWGKVKALYRN